MEMILYFLTWAYLSAFIILVCVSAVVFFRSARTPLYYAQILCCLTLLASLFIKMLQWHAPPSQLLHIIIIIDLLVWATALAAVFLGYYAAFFRRRIPLFLQMVSGAGALMLFLISTQLVERLSRSYETKTVTHLFIFFLCLPLLLFLIYLPLLLTLIRKHLLNTTSLSFYQIMHLIPDTVYVFNRQGELIDQNQTIHFLSDCQNLQQLIDAFEKHSISNCQDLLLALENPGQRVRGELNWLDGPDSAETWSWSCQALHKKRGKIVGTLLLLTNLSGTRQASHQLQQQNDELSRINQQLSDYREVIENYAGAATRQEIAHVVDASVSRRLDESLNKLKKACSSTSYESNLLIRAVVTECRQSLADVRDLVKRLSEY